MPVVLRCLLKTAEYGWRDRVNFFRGIFASMRLLWPQILAIDLPRQVPELRVPVYFVEGRHDWEAPSVLAERYLEALRAPRKELVWFERSAHLVNVEEADAFNAFFVERLLPETRGLRPGGQVPSTGPAGAPKN
jgi:pimeloyl-ACP methyl ester carboxylesterase